MTNSNTDKVKTVLILGATGGFGRALTAHMSQSGWQVRALTRDESKANDVDKAIDVGQSESTKVDWVVGNLDEPSSLKLAAENVDVIVHAVNVPYPKWDPLMLNYTRTIIDLARANHAHLMFVGNVYNAGLPEGGVIDEYTVHAPINNKGELRAELEDMLKAASLSGVQTTIMRFGDFFGPDIPTSNWFNECTKNVLKNKMSMGGPADLPHTWAYLPDAVKAMEQVATIRLTSTDLVSSTESQHMVLPFAGHVFSFAELQSVIEARTGTVIKAGALPWTLFKVLSIVWPTMRDIIAMRYLWDNDIQMDGSALTKLLGSAPEHTPLAQAVYTTVPGLRDA